MSRRVLVCAFGVVAALLAAGGAAESCYQYTERLNNTLGVSCASYVGDKQSWCPTSVPSDKVHHDWPNQAIYTKELAAALVANASCITQAMPAWTAEFLGSAYSSPKMGGSFGWTLEVFQPGYYDMPRKAGDRIESPWTLGMKCWAFAYLAQQWAALRDTFVSTLQQASLSAPLFEYAMDHGTANGMMLCKKVMANCFVNASYDPARNGTCPMSIDEFHLGFDWQNTLHGQHVQFTFNWA